MSNSRLKSSLIIILLTCLTGFVDFALNCSLVRAETKISHPLETTQPDPLLPSTKNKRPLTVLEKKRIKQAIIKLEQEAQAALRARNLEQAFSLWFRELRLQREVDSLAEIAALGRIGAIAWQENRDVDLRAIAKRLDAIQSEATTENEANPTLLKQIGLAYRKTRYLDKAIAIYQTILTINQPHNLRQNKLNIRQILGELYLKTFDYTQAESIYKQLLAKTKSNQQQEIYLNHLATIYERTKQFNLAIITKQRLLDRYQQTKQINKLASTQIAIAENYQLLENIAQAAEYYRQASDTSLTTQQYAVATEALNKLAELYQERDLLQYALQTYQQLALVQQKSYNYYGLMDTYDRLGKIYLSADNYSQAEASWRQGLELAKLLNYRNKYFSDRLKMVNNYFTAPNIFPLH